MSPWRILTKSSSSTAVGFFFYQWVINTHTVPLLLSWVATSPHPSKNRMCRIYSLRQSTEVNFVQLRTTPQDVESTQIPLIIDHGTKSEAHGRGTVLTASSPTLETPRKLPLFHPISKCCQIASFLRCKPLSLLCCSLTCSACLSRTNHRSYHPFNVANFNSDGHPLQLYFLIVHHPPIYQHSGTTSPTMVVDTRQIPPSSPNALSVPLY